ncbi:type II secretion system protein [Paenibacillus sp. FSL H8-0261]|uniref:type II secretion system protein n=1 Tax=Paenibacillus sp. FSL H8-0261 TaxID=2921381 RepID=UPI00324D53D5
MLAQAIKRRLSKEENQKGFTLIELLAVIVILGIIAVIAIPLIGNVINNSKKSADVATARQVYDAARLYVIGVKNGEFATAGKVLIKDIQKEGYLDKTYLPSDKKEITSGFVYFNAKGQLDNTAETGKTDAVTLETGSETADIHEFSADKVLSAKN